MKFGSVCSGIEAASVAFNPLGWSAAWLSEIEPFPCALLAHHYPTVPSLGDMTTIAARIASGEVAAPDLFCGGTPCQAFSVAGLRNSLDDTRGNLSLVFCDIANAIDTARALDGQPPAIVFWENVPGVLSTKDNAFGCFLAGLAGEDDPLVPPGGKWTNAGCVFGPQRTVAWRVLDAQYFGVAQRRRRVFVVASARNGFDPCEILFEFDGVRRDIAPSRQAGESVTGTLSARTESGGGLGTDFDLAGGVQAFALQHAQIGRKDSAGPQGKGWQKEVAFTQDSRSCADAVAVATPINTQMALRGADTSNTSREGVGVGEPGDPAFTLQAAHHHDVATATQVRRLTPTECSRLQGFPDDYTLVPHRNKPAADGPRYKALGNSWAVPVVAWIGRRIQDALSVCPDCGQPMRHAAVELSSEVCDTCFVEEFAGGDVAYAQELCGHVMYVFVAE